ncbi:MAG TPA: M23 family metallopeptidase [Candidatus Krumholzibacteria bacterium]|nr:M23 family metallopeptidase [Candidatus Krumholzibacteria bacterium]
MKSILAVALVLLATFTAARAADAPIDSAAALAKARALTPHVANAESGPLWSEFDDAMRAAMGDSVRFDAMLTGIRVEIGALEEILNETVDRERTMWVYRARCKFSRSDAPLLLLMAFAPDGRVTGLAVQPDTPQEYPSTKMDYQTQTTLDLPFRGEWFVVWGGRFIDDNYHAASKSQRFATDVLIEKNDATHTGDGSKLTDYLCYGEEVLAPGAGTVVWMCDSLPDQQPGKMDPAHPLGNGVIIDHGNGEFSVLAHMQPKSLRVQVGDRVDSSTVLGLVGNSGNTTEPHIHYHVMDGPDMATAEGLPVRFKEIVIDGETVPWAELVRGQTIRRVTK